MLEFIVALLAALRIFFRSRHDAAIEILAPRQQTSVLKRKRPRPPLSQLDRLFWTTLRRVWSRWAEILAVVKPVTVVGWHRAGFRLFCFFVIEHGRRRILHVNVTRLPTAEWVVQQLRETLPDAGAYRYTVLDRGSKSGAEAIEFLKATGLTPERPSIQSPWQNGIAERWVGGCRRELLDHVIPLTERRFQRLVRDYAAYFHLDRIHGCVEEDTPNRRAVEQKPAADGTVISIPHLGGLHRRYSWLDAA